MEQALAPAAKDMIATIRKRHVISVASGKGGTGKTTVAANLARLFSERAISIRILDCDVDEPNANLHFNCSIIDTENVVSLRPVLDKSLCTLCGKCEQACRFNAILVGKERVFIQEGICHSCGGCVLACPHAALSNAERLIGRIETFQSLCGIKITSGRSEIGETNLTKIIRKAREYERIEDVTIIDSPPGTSCSLAASVEGSDFCVVVTEPTEYGIHDMGLLIEALEKLRVPFGILVNKAGNGPVDIRAFCLSKGMPFIGEIPFDAHFYSHFSRERGLDALSASVHEAYETILGRILEIVDDETDSIP